MLKNFLKSQWRI